jgi:hypothetical protein
MSCVKEKEAGLIKMLVKVNGKLDMPMNCYGGKKYISRDQVPQQVGSNIHISTDSDSWKQS